MSIHGNNITIAIGDTDGLIAIISKRDTNHKRAFEIVSYCYEHKIAIVYPAAIIAEAITTATRKLKNNRLAHIIFQQIEDEGPLQIIDTTSQIIKQAHKLYNPKSSAKDTYFDAIVAATAKQQNTKFVFSFDKYYEKIGLILIDTHIKRKL